MSRHIKLDPDNPRACQCARCLELVEKDGGTLPGILTDATLAPMYRKPRGKRGDVKRSQGSKARSKARRQGL